MERYSKASSGPNAPESIAAREASSLYQELTELGLTSAEPGLMREYLKKRVPVMNFRTLAYVGSIASHAWEQGFCSSNAELMGLLIFIEQTAPGQQASTGIPSGYPDPAPQSQSGRRVPGFAPTVAGSQLCLRQGLGLRRDEDRAAGWGEAQGRSSRSLSRSRRS